MGPHRDDVDILLEGRNAASFASEGQQRSIALAMKLGQARKLEEASDSPPLFLIDDVFGELDPVRRNNLLAALPSSAQKLVTATTLHWMEYPGLRGRIRAQGRKDHAPALTRLPSFPFTDCPTVYCIVFAIRVWGPEP